MRWKLHTENLGGNLHAAATCCNSMGWAPFVLAMSSTGTATVVVLRVPEALDHKDIHNPKRMRLVWWEIEEDKR